VTAAKAAGVHPVLFAAANSSGGALGKMAMPLMVCVLVYPQASAALS
jgi:L-lactate permease